METNDNKSIIDSIKERIELSKYIRTKFESAFLQKDVDTLVVLEEMRTGEMSKEEEALYRFILDNLLGTHKPQIFEEFPFIKDTILPKLIEQGQVSVLHNNWYRWEGTGAEYGEFVATVAEKVSKLFPSANGLLVKEQYTNKGNAKKIVLQFAPYREIFINGKELEAAARAGNSRRNAYTQPTGKMKDL